MTMMINNECWDNLFFNSQVIIMWYEKRDNMKFSNLGATGCDEVQCGVMLCDFVQHCATKIQKKHNVM